MMRLFLAAMVAPLILSACAKSAQERVRTIEVKVPVPVQCLREDQIPVMPSGLGEPPSDVSVALSRALAKLIEWRAYGLAADAAMRAAAKAPGDLAAQGDK